MSKNLLSLAFTMLALAFLLTTGCEKQKGKSKSEADKFLERRDETTLRLEINLKNIEASLLKHDGDEEKAFKTYLEVANLGDPSAQHTVAEWYEAGKGINKDEKEALRWYIASAKSKHLLAMKKLVDRNLLGLYEGIESTELLSIVLNTADEGSCVAMTMLATLLIYGEENIRDYEDGVKWLKRSIYECENQPLLLTEEVRAAQKLDDRLRNALRKSNRCERQSMLILASVYEKGTGVPQDYASAYMWYNLCASRGDEVAKIQRETLAEKMSPQQIADGQKLSREWTRFSLNF